MKHFILKMFALFMFLSTISIKTQAAGPEPFRLTMIDVGQGLCVLVEVNGHAMLYDGGGRKKSSMVVSYLKQQGIEKLDYIIASHFDEDHISGLIGAMHAFSCDTVMEADYEADTDIYQSFVNTAETSSANIIRPVQGEEYLLGDAIFDIVAPQSYDSETENNRSIGIRITYGNTSYLLCGDTGEDGESAMINSGENLDADLFVVDHHGSAYANTFYFLNAVTPKYALISCGENNTYGHPALETLERLHQEGCELYRTDKQGTIIASSDGESIWFNVDACQDWSSGTTSADRVNSDNTESTETAEESSGEYTYICNKNSKKIHYPYCDSVDKMNEENKLYTTETRDQLIAEGYEPCKNCNP